jgi:hypothetical protein
MYAIVWYENVTFGGCVREQVRLCARAYCCKLPNILVHDVQRRKIPVTACKRCCAQYVNMAVLRVLYESDNTQRILS